MRLTHIFSLKPEAIAMGKNPSRDGLAKRLVLAVLRPVLGRQLRADNRCMSAIAGIYQLMEKHQLRLRRGTCEPFIEDEQRDS